MTFEEKVKQTIGEMMFANMQLTHQVGELQRQLADQQKAFTLAQQASDVPAEKPLPEEIRANGGDKRPRTP